MVSADCLRLRVIVDRNPPSVVDDPNAAVGHEGDLGPGCEPGHRLVDGVVDHLPDEVMEAAWAGRADVHARPFAHRLEALEDGDVAGVVGRISDGAQSLLHGVFRGRVRGIGTAQKGPCRATDFMFVIIADRVTDSAIPEPAKRPKSQ